MKNLSQNDLISLTQLGFISLMGHATSPYQKSFLHLAYLTMQQVNEEFPDFPEGLLLECPDKYKESNDKITKYIFPKFYLSLKNSFDKNIHYDEWNKWINVVKDILNLDKQEANRKSYLLQNQGIELLVKVVNNFPNDISTVQFWDTFLDAHNSNVDERLAKYLPPIFNPLFETTEDVSTFQQLLPLKDDEDFKTKLKYDIYVKAVETFVKDESLTILPPLIQYKWDYADIMTQQLNVLKIARKFQYPLVKSFFEQAFEKSKFKKVIDYAQAYLAWHGYINTKEQPLVSKQFDTITYNTHCLLNYISLKYKVYNSPIVVTTLLNLLSESFKEKKITIKHQVVENEIFLTASSYDKESILSFEKKVPQYIDFIFNQYFNTERFDIFSKLNNGQRVEFEKDESFVKEFNKIISFVDLNEVISSSKIIKNKIKI